MRIITGKEKAQILNSAKSFTVMGGGDARLISTVKDLKNITFKMYQDSHRFMAETSSATLILLF